MNRTPSLVNTPVKITPQRILSSSLLYGILTNIAHYYPMSTYTYMTPRHQYCCKYQTLCRSVESLPISASVIYCRDPCYRHWEFRTAQQFRLDKNFAIYLIQLIGYLINPTCWFLNLFDSTVPTWFKFSFPTRFEYSFLPWFDLLFPTLFISPFFTRFNSVF